MDAVLARREDPAGKQALRLWLRLLSCTSLIERTVSARFRSDFDTSLSRFDFLAALERAGPAGLTLGEVSRALLVTNGAVTGLAGRLRADGLIEGCETVDRRVQRVRLTPEGARRFAAMAAAHEGWIVEAFAGLGVAEIDQLSGLLERAKRSLQHAEEGRDA